MNRLICLLSLFCNLVFAEAAEIAVTISPTVPSAGQIIQLNLELTTTENLAANFDSKKQSWGDFFYLSHLQSETFWNGQSWQQTIQIQLVSQTFGDKQIPELKIELPNQQLNSPAQQITVQDLFNGAKPTPQELQKFVWPAKTSNSLNWLILLLIVAIVLTAAIIKLQQKRCQNRQTDAKLPLTLEKIVENYSTASWQQLRQWLINNQQIDPFSAAKTNKEHQQIISQFQASFFKPNRNQADFAALITACQQLPKLNKAEVQNEL